MRVLPLLILALAVAGCDRRFSDQPDPPDAPGPDREDIVVPAPAGTEQQGTTPRSCDGKVGDELAACISPQEQPQESEDQEL
ncbi:hypothetical protein [Pseudoxanthomonas mexicana]|uniref:hypothetical protein n=1 Tax=Pseudoxanthomonas mexicana TaxID=128785 RepID=UPI00398B7BAA